MRTIRTAAATVIVLTLTSAMWAYDYGWDPAKIQAHGMYFEAREQPLYDVGDYGAWEYVIDCYAEPGAVGDYMIWGFANGDIENFHDGQGGWDPDYQQNIYQRWDVASAGHNYLLNLVGGGPSSPVYDYASYETIPDDVWELPGGRPFAIDNPVHAPSEYTWGDDVLSCAYDVNAGQAYTSYDGSGYVAGQDGLFLRHWDLVSTPGHSQGLVFSLRVVVEAPPQPTCWCPGYPTGQYYAGEVTWSLPSMGFEQGWGGLYPVLGLAPGPPVEDWGAYIEMLCDAIGTPDDSFDFDGDGDVDEDDLVFFVENIVGYDSDGDGYEDGSGTFRGDLNFDGMVNATDLATLHSTFGDFGPQVVYCDGDLNCDDIINATDLAILAGTFGQTAPAAPVPEPATLAIAAVGGLALLRRRT